MKPRTLILRTAGTNCDGETAHAFELAGASVERVHINAIMAEPARLANYQMLAIAGGFSYGDDVSAGKILANQLMHHLKDALHDFVSAGKPVIGICNGFQVLVKTDLLPGKMAAEAGGQSATLTNNDCGRFVDRWVRLLPIKSRCIWTNGMETAASAASVIELPIAHGEGKFVPASAAARAALWANEQVALVYAKADGTRAGNTSPDNPNGSVDDIAGVCDATGLVFGLMPHPERFTSFTQHPAWTSRASRRADGLPFFQNAVAHARQGVGAGV